MEDEAIGRIELCASKSPTGLRLFDDASSVVFCCCCCLARLDFFFDFNLSLVSLDWLMWREDRDDKDAFFLSLTLLVFLLSLVVLVVIVTVSVMVVVVVSSSMFLRTMSAVVLTTSLHFFFGFLLLTNFLIFFAFLGLWCSWLLSSSLQTYIYIYG